VLRGGPGAERQVSLASGQNVARALRQCGYAVCEGDIAPGDLAALEAGDFDVVFPVLHGTFGEDGQLQQIMEDRGLCYVGSDPASSRLAMNKYQAKAVFESAGLATPQSVLIETNRAAVIEAGQLEQQIQAAVAGVGLPCVVKPNCQGSSIGITIASVPAQAADAVTATLRDYGDCLIERYVAGRELTVGIIGRQVLPVIQVQPRRHFYDYLAKYEDDHTEYIFDLDLDGFLLDQVSRQGWRAFASLGCRDLGRVDMILTNAAEVFILEVNTMPGFTEHSLVPKAAARAGLTCPEICDQIVRIAYRRSIRQV